MKTNKMKVFKLALNPIYGKKDEKRLVALGSDPIKLSQWYNNFKTVPYVENGVQKSFAKGTPLENYYPAEYRTDMCGIIEDWITVDTFEEFKLHTPHRIIA